MRWRPDDVVVMRYGRNGRFDGAEPVRIVGERGGYVAAWLAPGTRTMVPSLGDGRPIRAATLAKRFSAERLAQPGRWHGEGILKLIPERGAHSIWLFWSPERAFRGWYVNLEEAHTFSRRRIDTCDHVLDVWVEPDRSWQWKDEHELLAAVEHSWVAPELAAEVCAEGERVIGLLERWKSPFADGWEQWRPDPSWPVPELPEDWEHG